MQLHRGQVWSNILLPFNKYCPIILLILSLRSRRASITFNSASVGGLQSSSSKSPASLILIKTSTTWSENDDKTGRIVFACQFLTQIFLAVTECKSRNKWAAQRKNIPKIARVGAHMAQNFILKRQRTEIQYFVGENIKEPVIKYGQSEKQASLRFKLQSLLTVSITVPYTQRKISKTQQVEVRSTI